MGDKAQHIAVIGTMKTKGKTPAKREQAKKLLVRPASKNAASKGVSLL
jgi:hypothetical protein